MALKALTVLFVAPEVNPANRKATSIPVLNPFNQYGRVFFFSWMGFMVAFLSWYAFPPLVSPMPSISSFPLLLQKILCLNLYQYCWCR